VRPARRGRRGRRRGTAPAGAVKVAALLATLVLSACGFRPLYGAGPDQPQSYVVRELGAIQVGLGPDRVDQVVYGNLLDRLTPYGVPQEPRYRLALQLNESKQGVALERDATVSRFNLALEVGFTLQDAVTGESLFSGGVRAVAAYNVLRSEFANVIAERDARDRAARDIADEIKTRLSVYFRGLAAGAR
jgi:LPS-assembly lipoprotein